MCVVCQYVGWGCCRKRHQTLGVLGILSLIFLVLGVFLCRRVPSGPADLKASVGFAEDGLYYGLYYGDIAMKYAKLRPMCKIPFKRDFRLVCELLAMATLLAMVLACIELFWFRLLDGLLISIVISSAFVLELAQLARRAIRRI